MAVPKKKMSRSKRNLRRISWERKSLKQVSLALILGKLYLNKKNNNFVFPSEYEI